LAFRLWLLAFGFKPLAISRSFYGCRPIAGRAIHHARLTHDDPADSTAISSLNRRPEGRQADRNRLLGKTQQPRHSRASTSNACQTQCSHKIHVQHLRPIHLSKSLPQDRPGGLVPEAPLAAGRPADSPSAGRLAASPVV